MRLGGKVLRVDRDGNAAPNNNAPSGGDRRIFAYGFRNPQGITFRPGSGNPYISEHGPDHSDEVTSACGRYQRRLGSAVHKWHQLLWLHIEPVERRADADDRHGQVP